jgi:hypothetical protein
MPPLQPPPDELLVTLQQFSQAGHSTVDVPQLTAMLGGILQPLGWRPLAVQSIVIPGPRPGGSSPVFTVVRYRNTNPQAAGQAVFLAVGTILQQRSRALQGQPGGVTLVSVTPNWAIASAGNLFIQGGPGGLPAAVSAAGGWHFAFPTLAPTSHFLTAPASAAVLVLDTAPTVASMAAAAQRYPANALLAGVVGQLTARGHWHSALGPQPVVPQAHQQACGSATLYPAYVMADHGLFVAGIVHDIAPACELTIVRVLNEWGAGYLSDLLAGLARVTGTGPTVVNMSLTVRMPGRAALHAELSSSANAAVRALLDEWQDLPADACAPLAAVLQGLWAGNVVLVAATGNDSGAGPLADPRAPAAFASTLGVAAVNHLGTRACYSNRGDDRLEEGDDVANGLATLGGDSTGAVHGLYGASSIALPRPWKDAVNQGGWAQWMGTSFAAPVISALAANYLANNPAASPDQVMGALRAAATPTDPTLKAPTLRAVQVPL